MSVTRPQHFAIAGAVTRGLVMHDVTFREVWEALTLLEPPIAASAATARTADDLTLIDLSAERFASDNAATETAAHGAAEFFRSVGSATHNQVLMLAQEPLLQLLEPSLRVMVDEVPQARLRITIAQRKISEALRSRDPEGARTWMSKHIRDFRKGFEIAGIDLEHRITA